MPCEPAFDAAFRAQLRQLLIWRRDVRRFRPDPLPQGLIEKMLELACLAPSVGLSQPWRFILVDDPLRRAAVRRNFETCNSEALAGQEPERAAQYARLKLERRPQGRAKRHCRTSSNKSSAPVVERMAGCAVCKVFCHGISRHATGSI
jgi:nitroreductase